MKRAALFFPLAFMSALVLSCDADPVEVDRSASGNPDCLEAVKGGNKTKPLALLCVIAVPGNPITSSAKSWVDPVTERYYFADASNSGVGIIDAETNVWVTRVTGMSGVAPAGGGTSTTNGPGPSAVNVLRNGQMWVSDGNATVRVFNVALNAAPFGQPIATISTNIPACDGGTATTHYCGRANEMAFDPDHEIMAVENPSPLSVAAGHAAIDPYVTFISTRPPYTVLGSISFANAGNVEGPVWEPGLQRFLLPVAFKAADAAVRGSQYYAVINPQTRTVDNKFIMHCPDIIGSVSTTIMNNLQLAPNNRLLGQVCGRPVIMDSRTGNVLKVITEVGTGDQDWYNPGDGLFFVVGADATTGVASIGVIDVATMTWKQNIPHILGGGPSAFEENNHLFSRVQVNAAIVAAPATDNSLCNQAGVKGRVAGKGCIAVFAHQQ